MPKYFLRNWTFEGSNDGVTFDPIYQHNNDMTINEQCLHGSWALPPVHRAYRIFRLHSRIPIALVASCFDPRDAH
eukprot:gene23432-1715_t